MSAAPTGPDLPPPSRSGRLLALVRRLIDYGKQLAATLRQRAVPNDTTDLVCNFGTDHLPLILARIAQGLHRAGLLEERIARTAGRLDAEPQAKPAPTPRAPRALPCEAQPPSPRRAEPQQPTDAASMLANLPTPEQIAAKVRRQSIGVVLADICRDLGLSPSHPLWENCTSPSTNTAATGSAWPWRGSIAPSRSPTSSPGSKPNLPPRPSRPAPARRSPFPPNSPASTVNRQARRAGEDNPRPLGAHCHCGRGACGKAVDAAPAPRALPSPARR